MPELIISHLQKMTDRVGLFQHATLTKPNTSFGYCTDDNARAALFMVQAMERSPNERRLQEPLGVYFRFCQAALDEETHQLHNLLGHDGRWAKEAGPGDSVGRLLWALGGIIGSNLNAPQRVAAKSMFERALPLMKHQEDLRPIACAILGACAYLKREQSKAVSAALEDLVTRLAAGFETDGDGWWPWPEQTLTYENARIPHALIAAGQTLERPDLVTQGLTSLRWLVAVQTYNGVFSPVGNDGWYQRGSEPARFDQQPMEAEATIAACDAAHAVDQDASWLPHAQAAFDWFLGANAISQPVCVPATGGCCDGLGPTEVNGNQGAESTLSWLSAQLAFETIRTRANQQPAAGRSR